MTRPSASPPTSSTLTATAGAAYQRLGLYQLALEDHDAAIRLDPKDPVSYSNRGVAHLRLGQYERAVEDYDQAIRLDPRTGEAYAGRSLAYTALGRHKEARRDAERAAKLGIDLATLKESIQKLTEHTA